MEYPRLLQRKPLDFGAVPARRNARQEQKARERQQSVQRGTHALPSLHIEILGAHQAFGKNGASHEQAPVHLR